jgi:hypothetical protein
MSEQRQKIQLEPALPGAREGEARTALRRGTESLMAEGATESPATERMMEEICEAGNLSKAVQRVRANKGAPGIDGMTIAGAVSETSGGASARNNCVGSQLRRGP